MIFHKPICSFDDQTASVAWHFVSNDRPNNSKRFCSIWPERRAAYSSSLFAYLTIRKNNAYRRSILLFDIDHGIRYEHLPIYLDTRRIDYTDYPIVYCFPRDKPITRASDFRAPTRDLHATAIKRKLSSGRKRAKRTAKLSSLSNFNWASFCRLCSLFVFPYFRTEPSARHSRTTIKNRSNCHRFLALLFGTVIRIVRDRE